MSPEIAAMLRKKNENEENVATPSLHNQFLIMVHENVLIKNPRVKPYNVYDLTRVSKAVEAVRTGMLKKNVPSASWYESSMEIILGSAGQPKST